VPWLRRLVAGLSPRRPGFDPGSVNVGFVVDEVALGQVFLLVLRFSPVSIILLVLHTHLHLHVAFTRTDGRSLGTFQISGSSGYKSTFHPLFLYRFNIMLTLDSPSRVHRSGFPTGIFVCISNLSSTFYVAAYLVVVITWPRSHCFHSWVLRRPNGTNVLFCSVKWISPWAVTWCAVCAGVKVVLCVCVRVFMFRSSSVGASVGVC
jgi:hypothetical protein